MVCWIGGVILLSAAMGIYQAYFPVAVAALVGDIIIRTVSENKEPSWIWKTGIRYLTILSLSICLYLLITKTVCHIGNIPLTTHRDMNNMGKVPLSQYPELIKATYLRWWSLLTNIDGISCSPLAKHLYRFLTIMFIAVAAVNSIAVIKKNYKSGILLLALFIVFPIAVNLMEIMDPGWVVERMMYGFVITFLLILSLGEKYTKSEYVLKNAIMKKGYILSCRHLIPLIVTGFISVYVYYTNVEYFRMDFVQSQAKSYFTTLITRINSTDGYESDMPVVFVGQHSYEGLDTSFKSEYYNMVPYSTNDELKELINSYTWITFMRRWCGFSSVVEDESDYKDLPEVQQMTTYPDDGSIEIIDHVVVVKLS